MAKQSNQAPDLTGVSDEIKAYIDSLVTGSSDLTAKVDAADKRATEAENARSDAVKRSDDLEAKVGAAEKRAAEAEAAAKDATNRVNDVEAQLAGVPDIPEGAIIIDLEGLEKINDDLSRKESFGDTCWLRCETINFRADSGYSTNMIDRVKGAIDRAFRTGGALRSEFGTVTAQGQTWDKLPPFHGSNRVLIVVGVVGEAAAEPG